MIKNISYSFLLQSKITERKSIYKTAMDIHLVLKIWKRRKMTLERKIVIFKTIVISTIIFQSPITTFPKHVDALEKT